MFEHHVEKVTQHVEERNMKIAGRMPFKLHDHQQEQIAKRADFHVKRQVARQAKIGESLNRL